MQNQCSFCGGCIGQRGDAVSIDKKIAHVIAGPNVYICDICVDLCKEIVDEAKEEKMLDEPTGEEDLQAEAERAEPPEQAQDDIVASAKKWLTERGYLWAEGRAVNTAMSRGWRPDGWAPPPPKPPPPVELDEKTRRLASDLEAVLVDLRTGRSKLAIAYRLRDLAVDAGYELPKPGLEPDELAAVVRLARAAPEGKIDEYVAAMRKDMAAWEKASRKNWLQGHAWLGALGALGISTYLMSKLGGKR